MPRPADIAEGYIRNAVAESELRAPRLGLSLSQRKLLTLVDETHSVADMASILHSDETRVRRDLARLIELRLVRPALPAPTSRTPEAGRVADAPRLAASVPAARMAPASRRRGVGIAVVAAVGIATAAVVAWPPRERMPAEGQVRAAAPLPTNPLSAAAAAADATGGPIRQTAPVEGMTAASLVVPERPTDAAPPVRAEVRRASAPQRLALTAPQPTPSSAPREGARGDVAPPSATPATSSSATASAATAAGAIASPAVVSRPSPAAPGTAPAATAQTGGDEPVAATLPERPAIAPPVVVPAPRPAAGQPPSANPPLRTPAEPAAPVRVATAPATAPAPPPQPKLVPITREEPEFPREALLANVASGRVRARLTVEKDGRVSSVAIVSAEPRRVFDRAVDRALSRWRFEPSAEARTTEVEVDFNAN